ncbi:MAG: acylphosphatase [Gemmatimonadetes bacterium]|nr:MAG: acylphosphatase [Gemmatimonadota bacterium]PYO71493.1 MAG: acylphosphatase [Gemmatimonadota bacterium]PYO72883.1 MAG: acylphosphatase [Gemmatimonadota bacterium]PYO96238.1 MAG: acylphosphatase [Gemmatimonadota bacterium]TLY45959.1 MAG: acylphosphatase [Gemmatimonadota bacterium]
MAAKRFLVHGQVQGVGFRWFVGRHAERLNLRGFARNVHDGSVEVVAAGSEAALAQLGQVLAKGPATARVERVDASDFPHEETLPNDFDIR